MTKAEVEKALIEFNGGSPFVNISRIAKFLRIRNESAGELVAMLDRIESGREKRFYAGDVAREILRKRV